MSNNFYQEDAMSASGEKELLKVLIDKTVDIGKAMRELREALGKMQPEEVLAGLEKRIGGLEQSVTEIGNSTNKRIEGLEGMLGTLGDELGGLSQEVAGPGSKIGSQMWGLQQSIDKYVDFFKGPTTKEVHHRHFVGRVIWVIAGLIVLVMVCWYLTARSLIREEAYAQNDILWRAAMQADDSVVTGTLNRVRRDYEAGPEQFRKDVVAEEERLAESYRQWLQNEAGKAKMKELESMKKKR